MLITFLEVATLLAIIIVPIGGPSTKKKNKALKIDRDIADAHYAINKEGFLEQIQGKELSRHEH